MRSEGCRLCRHSWLLGIALALWPSPVQAGEHCELVKEAAAGDVVPVRLTCTTDLDSERLFAIVRDPLQQAKAFSSLGARTRVLSDEGDHLRVLQFHESRLIADREVIVEWRVTGSSSPHVVAWRTAGGPERF